jgi:tetratricopeptide (TPR) repeat protein
MSKINSFRNKLKPGIILILFIFLSAVPLSLISKAPANPIAMGDKYFHQMRYRDAVAWYEKEPALAEAQWKMARSLVCYADIISGEERKSYLTKAEKAARRCIELDEKDANGHTWLAGILGNMAMFEGSRAKVRLCNEIKKELDRALTLNSEDDIAYSILGTFYRVLGNINWFERNLAAAFLGRIPEGGYEDAEISLLKAMKISPNTMRHPYELGLLYLDWAKNDLAKQFFLKAQKCPVLIGSDKHRLSEINKHLENL